MFEMPSLMMRECEQLHLPNALQALDHSLYVMQSFQESDYGLQIAMGIPGAMQASGGTSSAKPFDAARRTLRSFR